MRCGTDGVTFVIDGGGVPSTDTVVFYATKFYSRPAGQRVLDERRQRCERDWILRDKSPWVGKHAFKATAVGAAMTGNTLRRLVISAVFPSPAGAYIPPPTVSADNLTVHVHVTMESGHLLFEPSIMQFLRNLYGGW
jgi:hypothetical protein